MLCYALWNLKTSKVLRGTRIVVGSRIKFDCLVFFFLPEVMCSHQLSCEGNCCHSATAKNVFSSIPSGAGLGQQQQSCGSRGDTAQHRAAGGKWWAQFGAALLTWGPVVLQVLRASSVWLCINSGVAENWWQLSLLWMVLKQGQKRIPEPLPEVSRSPQALPCRFVASFPVLNVSYTSVQLVFLQNFLLDWIPQCTYGCAKNKSFMGTIAYRFTGNGNAYKGLMSSNLRLLNNVAEYIFTLDKQHWSPQEFCL